MDRATLSGIALCMAFGCGGARSSSPAESDQGAVTRTCNEEAARQRLETSKVDGKLQIALAQWHVDSCYARSGKYPQLKPAEVDRRRVTVIVTTTAESETLASVGLQPGVRGSDQTSGVIALRDVARLAALREVTAIALQPEIQPLSGRAPTGGADRWLASRPTAKG